MAHRLLLDTHAVVCWVSSAERLSQTASSKIDVRPVMAGERVPAPAHWSRCMPESGTSVDQRRVAEHPSSGQDVMCCG